MRERIRFGARVRRPRRARGGRRWIPIALLALGVSGLAATADAACVAGTCGLAGNARFELDYPIAVPYTTLSRPDGRIVALSGITLMQGGIAPRSLSFAGSELTAAATPTVLPLFPVNPMLFQLASSIMAAVPNGPAVLSGGGRTGPSTVSWCPGFVLPAPGVNPGCLGPASGSPLTGLLRYTRTASQFGGPAAAAFGGTRNVAVRVGSSAPCAGPGCVFGIGSLAFPNTPAVGNAFGSTLATRPSNVPGVFSGSVTAFGSIAALGAPIGNFPASSATSWGGPWTTGMLTVSLTGPGAAVLITTGTDTRNAAGSGVVSMVAGGLVQRSNFGPTVTAGWLNLLVPEPVGGLGTAAALATLALCHAATRVRRLRGRVDP